MKVEQSYPAALLAAALSDIEICQLLHLREHTCDEGLGKFMAADQSRPPAFYNRGANAGFEHNCEHLWIVQFIEEGFHPFGDGIRGCVPVIAWHLFDVRLGDFRPLL
jgi:hypothetical protein